MNNLRNDSLNQVSVHDLERKEEKASVVLKVDPSRCKMWPYHNRDYVNLTEENCRDLIDSFIAQGRQEFPAVVRKITDLKHDHEIICGARRRWAATWMRENGYPDFWYVIEVRELTDIEAFQLADLENRNRDDISHYERATDYLKALGAFYNGSQKEMALHLRVKDAWLSRYLDLARLPREVINAFPHQSSILPGHAKRIKQQLNRPGGREELMKMASSICSSRENLSVKEVMKKLVNSVPRSAEKDYVNKSGEKIFTTEVVKGVLKLAINLKENRAPNNDLKKAFAEVLKSIGSEVIVR